MRVRLPVLRRTRPARWPHFTSSLRSTALTARLGRVLGIALLVCFATGLLSHYQYRPWSWLPEPATPVWGYRLTQGVHVATGTATIPLLLVKLWSVYPNLFRWPPVTTLAKLLERLSVGLLVGSALIQLFTGYLNVLNWYPWPWDFTSVHRFLAYVLIGSTVLHVAVKLPDIRYGLSVPVADGDVLTEIPWSDNPDAHSNAGQVDPPQPRAISRRGVLVATAAGGGTVIATTVGQTLTPLQRLGILAARRPQDGPQGVPVNKTALQADVIGAATSPDWTLSVRGPRPFRLSLADLAVEPLVEQDLPIACVEGWSVGARWRGLSLHDLVLRAGGDASSSVRVDSLERSGAYRSSVVHGPQLGTALLATHLNGARLDIDHGYPLRLIAPDRAGVLNTKWLTAVELLS